MLITTKLHSPHVMDYTDLPKCHRHFAMLPGPFNKPWTSFIPVHMEICLGIFRQHHHLLMNCRGAIRACLHSIVAAAQTRRHVCPEEVKPFRLKDRHCRECDKLGQLELGSHTTNAIFDLNHLGQKRD